MKSSKSASTVLLEDSIVASFLRYPNIWYKFFNVNCGISGDKIQNILWKTEYIPLPQSLEYILINCGTNSLDTDDSEKVADGLFRITRALKKRIIHLKVVINGILPRMDEIQ